MAFLTSGAASNQEPLHGFIVGMSRSGTTWLARSLHKHPDITVFGETAFWGRRHIVPSSIDGRYERADFARLSQLHSTASQITELNSQAARVVFRTVAEEAQGRGDRLTPGEFYRRICRRLADLEGTAVVVEKTPHHINWVDRITASLPDSRFLVCLRDPYEFLLSYKHQGDRKPQPVSSTFQSIYHPIVTSLVARQYLKVIAALQQDRSVRSNLVRLEDFRRDAAGVLSEAQDFLGVESPKIVLADQRNSSFPERERPELDASEVFWLSSIAGSHAAKVGYTRRSPGSFGLRWFVPLLTLPVALIHIVRIVARATERPLLEYIGRWLSSYR